MADTAKALTTYDAETISVQVRSLAAYRQNPQAEASLDLHGDDL
jgi:hypothetical protein